MGEEAPALHNTRGGCGFSYFIVSQESSVFGEGARSSRPRGLGPHSSVQQRGQGKGSSIGGHAKDQFAGRGPFLQPPLHGRVLVVKEECQG